MDYFLLKSDPLAELTTCSPSCTVAGALNYCANEQCVGEGALGCTFNTPPPPTPPCSCFAAMAEPTR
jgi:hypothetical protein